MTLKGALHIHSTCSDGELSIAELAQVYQELGFDFIAITDHDHLLKPECYQKQMEQTKTDMLVFLGVELTHFVRGYVHVSQVQGDKEVLHVFNHPSSLNLPLEKVIQHIEAVSQHFSLDAVEITQNGYYTPEYDIDQIPYPKIATDDAHTLLTCGRAWVEVDSAREKDAIIRAIRRGDFQNSFTGKGC
ncbi:MAG: PHP domain-containing protein [Pseudomonadota bacterium]